MSGEHRWHHAEALIVAESLLASLSPACDRIELAGSIRRGRPDVGDIELLCIPKAGDNAFYHDDLDEVLRAMMACQRLAPRPSKIGTHTYGPKNKLLVHVPSGIPVDVFSTDAKNWGMAFVVRTGPAELNIRMMARFKSIGFAGHAYGGVTNRQGQEIECPDEETVFRLLGWPYMPPEQRR